MFVSRFPNLSHDPVKDKNPAIQVYGRRFLKDQTEIEHLIEFLLLFISKKSIESTYTGEAGFPPPEALNSWPDETQLKYYPPPRLALKLFTFLGASQLESRHDCHKEQFEEMVDVLKSRIEVSSSISKDQVLTWIEQVLVGFVGVSQNRAWSTHCFLPASHNLIARETVWDSSKAKKHPSLHWETAIELGIFTSRQIFLGRSGEILYLQLCNLFRAAVNQEIEQFEREIGYPKGTAKKFQTELEDGLRKFLCSVPMVDSLTRWIEDAAPETLEAEEKLLPALCAWCPSDTWKEAYFFAYEMRNVCNATLDPLEEVEMLKLCCVLQVMRTLCAQAARHWEGLTDDIRGSGGANGFAWIVTAQETQERSLKELARRNLVRVQEIIHGVLRHSELNVAEDYKYGNADKQAQDLFVKLGKKIGFIAPWKGPGARFVMTEALLRYFVLALLPPGTRMTLRSFKEALFRHYGIGVNGDHLNKAIHWTYPNQPIELRSIEDDWLEEQLRATGFLIPLSDAVSLVHNPFGKKDRA